MSRKSKTHERENASAVRRTPETSVQARREPLRQATPAKDSTQALNAPLQALAPTDILALQRTVGNDVVQRVLAGALGKSERKEKRTGLPDNLKAGIEALSGISMGDVQVHYNSAKPAQVGALAYTQGTDIHVGPDEEKYLPHEAWHVVQQKQGRVKPTLQAKGVAINDDQTLEREADAMGSKAQRVTLSGGQMKGDSEAVQSKTGTTIIRYPAIQLTLDTAAEALFKDGERTVRTSHFNKAFNTEHGVTKADKKSIQEKLTALRDAEGKREVKTPPDITVKENRPTAGGMAEEDAAKLAPALKFEPVTDEFKCTDPSHTPKGKLYTNGKAYFGADKDGHVGWGFKVWTKKDKTTLEYKGNSVWDGEKWVYKSRGT